MQKNMLVVLIATVLIFIALPIVSAATMTAPVNFGNYTTGTNNVTLTVTVTGNAGNNMTNVSCYYNSSGGPISKFNLTNRIVQILNTSSTQTTFTGTGTLSSESSIYNVTCLVQNGTSLNTTVSARNITIDGTNPTVTLSRTSSDTDMYGVQYLTWTSTDTLSGIKSTLVRMTSPDTAICPDRTWATTSGTNTLVPDTDLACAGTYTVSLQTIDHSGNGVDGTNVTFTVNAPGAMAGSSVGAGSSGVPAVSGVISGPGLGKKKTTMSWNSIFLIAIIIGIIYFLIKKK